MKKKVPIGKKNAGINENILNALTAKTIEDAHKGIGLGKPIKNVDNFIKSL